MRNAENQQRVKCEKCSAEYSKFHQLLIEMLIKLGSRSWPMPWRTFLSEPQPRRTRVEGGPCRQCFSRVGRGGGGEGLKLAQARNIDAL